MEPRTVYGLAVAEGLSHEAAIIATAIAWGESGLNPDAVGDGGLQDDTWGPSCGLWQIRSIKAQSGTGLSRDADRLKDPSFNAAAMASISNNGSYWQPWTIYRNGAYLQYVDQVRAAVGGKTMEVWMPGVVHNDRSGLSDMATDGSPVIVLHITVSNGPASYNGTEPHFEVNRDGSIIQYVALDRNAKALWNEPGGVETNRQGICHQIEMVWYNPLTVGEMSDAQLEGVARCCLFIRDYSGVRFAPPPMGFYSDQRPLASADGVLRMTFDEWREWDGFCGHVNVPENDHWDPGPFPWDRFMAIVHRLDSSIKDEEDELAGEGPYIVAMLEELKRTLRTDLGENADAGVVLDKWRDVFNGRGEGDLDLGAERILEDLTALPDIQKRLEAIEKKLAKA